MKKYTKKELVEIIERINKMQRTIFKYKKEYGREPTLDEISSILQEPIERIYEINQVLKELEEQDKQFEEELRLKKKNHSKDDILNARKKRNDNITIQDIKNDI